MKSFVLRTDAFSVPHYFCGLLEGDDIGLIGNPLILSPLIFCATQFAARKDAEMCIDDLELAPAFTISETEFGMSDDLSGLLDG